jgi:uncharacterized membrane protein YphA (DoxX/SURF4 family)
MLVIDGPQTAWVMLAARVLIAIVFLVSGLHKGISGIGRRLPSFNTTIFH